MQILSPLPNTVFTITSDAAWPSMPFQTDADGPHTWSWQIVWNTFKESGVVNTALNQWEAQTAVVNLGGTLTVTVTAGNDTATMTVQITGTNPTAADVTAFVNTHPNSAGFDKILKQETNFHHFDTHTNEPVKSFDNGYGMAQLTKPAPAFDHVWNWQLNILAGLLLFAGKRTAAIAFLKQSGRTATDDQILHESVCRWNGGPYHVWDAAKGWIRNPIMLCDPTVGNMGWDMTDPANTGKTLATLHARDFAAFRHPPVAGAHWRYSGICYADKVLA